MDAGGMASSIVSVTGCAIRPSGLVVPATCVSTKCLLPAENRGDCSSSISRMRPPPTHPLFHSPPSPLSSFLSRGGASHFPPQVVVVGRSGHYCGSGGGLQDHPRSRRGVLGGLQGVFLCRGHRRSEPRQERVRPTQGSQRHLVSVGLLSPICRGNVGMAWDDNCIGKCPTVCATKVCHPSGRCQRDGRFLLLVLVSVSRCPADAPTHHWYVAA